MRRVQRLKAQDAQKHIGIWKAAKTKLRSSIMNYTLFVDVSEFLIYFAFVIKMISNYRDVL